MSDVKVFISSLVSGYEPYRAAVGEAVEALGHQVVRAEDFSASPGTPQQACLAESSLHQIAMQTMTALKAIHEARLIHCDFEPANIILGGTERGSLTSDCPHSGLHPSSG
jgi:RIO-like serine/threonine protein kinase